MHRLRRPSVVAWSVNQAARARSPQVASLFDAGDALRAAIGSGDGAEIRSAMRARRTLVEELTDASLDFAAKVSPSPAGHRDAIAATWEAASLERDEVRNTVEAGRLSAELDPSDPAELAGRARPDESATAAATGRRRAARPEAKPARLPRDELAVRRAEAALAEARNELSAASDHAAEAEADLAAAERAVQRARTARERATRKVERAEQQLDDRRSR